MIFCALICTQSDVLLLQRLEEVSLVHGDGRHLDAFELVRNEILRWVGEMCTVESHLVCRL